MDGNRCDTNTNTIADVAGRAERACPGVSKREDVDEHAVLTLENPTQLLDATKAVEAANFNIPRTA